jgi:hypothetical protein
VKVADLLESKRPRLLVTPTWRPEDVKYFHIDGGIKVVFPVIKKPRSLLDINTTDGPNVSYVARQVIGALLELNEKRNRDIEIQDDMGEHVGRFENQVRLHGAFLVKNVEQSELEAIVANAYEKQKKLKQANLDLERRRQIDDDNRFIKDLLDRDDDIKEARSNVRKLSRDERALVNDIFLKLDDTARGLRSKMPSEVSPLHYMNQYTIKKSVATITVNPTIVVPDNNFVMRVSITPDERENKLRIPDLYDGDSEIARKLQQRTKLTRPELDIVHTTENIFKILFDAKAVSIRYYLPGDDNWQEFDGNLSNILQFNRGKRIVFEALW